MRRHARLARYAAPAAFLLAATIAILLVRAGSRTTRRRDARRTAATTDGRGDRRGRRRPAGTTTDVSGAEFYEIEPGDTLAVIADQLDTTVEQLLVLNPDVDPSR